MWWNVKLITPTEIHVYPLAEESEHIIRGSLCNCMPTVRIVHGGQMIVHKKIAETTKIRAHWINRRNE